MTAKPDFSSARAGRSGVRPASSPSFASWSSVTATSGEDTDTASSPWARLFNASVVADSESPATWTVPFSSGPR